MHNMNLPISILVLVAIGQAASKLPNKNFGPSQLVKRELYEGTFGQKNRFVLLGTTEPTPGIQYYDDFKQDLEDPSSQHKIFGAQLASIPKISDLLSGYKQPFEDAVNSHLYSPVSVYNVRVASNPLDAPAAPGNHLSDLDFIKQLNELQSTKVPSRKEHETHLKVQPRFTSAHNTELYSFSKSKHIPHVFRQSSLDFDSEAKSVQKTFQRQNSFPETSKLLPIPALELYRFPFIKHAQKQSPQYYQPQDAQYASSKLKYDEEGNNQNISGTSIGQDFPRNEYKRPEIPEDGLVPGNVYNSHPNGAISYASFTHNQELLDRPKLQLHFPEQNQRLNEQQANYHHQFVSQPQPVQQQVYPVDNLQHQLKQRTSLGQIVTIPQSQLRPLYVNPIRQTLPYELQKKQPDFQPLDYHYPSTIPSKPGQTNTYFKLLTESKQLGLLGDASSQANNQDASDTIRLVPIRHITPMPTSLSYKESTDHYHLPTTVKPQKLKEQVDQITQTTTVEPQVSVKTVKDKQTSTVSPSDQTVIPLPSTSTKHQQLQTFETTDYSPLTIPPPEILSHAQQSHRIPHHSVEVQRQELQEIHSKLAPETRPLHQTNTKVHKHRALELTPQKYQRFTTPLPTSSTSHDYEIEISSNIDPKQLPKDLRPVPTSQTEIQRQREQTNQYTQQHNRNSLFDLEQNLQEDQIQHQVQNQQKEYSKQALQNQPQVQYLQQEQNQQQLQYQPGEQSQKQIQYPQEQIHQQDQNQQQIQYQPKEQNQGQIQYPQQKQIHQQDQNQQQIQYQPKEQSQEQIQYPQKKQIHQQDQNQQQIQYQPKEQNQGQIQYPQQKQIYRQEQNQQQIQYQPKEQNQEQIQYPDQEQIQQEEQDLQTHHLLQELQFPPQTHLDYDNANLQNYDIHTLTPSDPLFLTAIQQNRQTPGVFSHSSEFIDSENFDRNPVINFPSMQYFERTF